jgi:adenylyltransferase/sulfurtransferase
MDLDEQRLLRYSRQILLPEIDITGQEKILAGHVAIFGLGGLGSPVSMYLAAAGVGRLTLIDFDTVELSNLQRQIVHGTGSLKERKVESAKQRLNGLNPDCDIATIDRKLEAAELDEVIGAVDVVVDGTDNFDSRFAINAACYRKKRVLVSGAAIRFEGQVSVFHPGIDASPCYQCLYTNSDGVAETCSENGVVAPLLGIIGSIQALETLKLLARIGTDLTGRLLLFDGLTMEWQTMRFGRDPRCPVCGDPD